MIYVGAIHESPFLFTCIVVDDAYRVQFLFIDKTIAKCYILTIVDIFWSIVMKKRRYGKIRLRNYSLQLMLIGALWIMGVIALFINALVECSIFFGIVLLSLLYLFYPYFETFQISDNVIVTNKFLFSSKIIIPDKTIVIISKADVIYPLSVQSVLLKDRYAVSILKDMPLETALNMLHGKYKSQFLYTNGTVERRAGYNFVYSFVLEKELIEKVLNNTICTVIIPESIKDNIVIENSETNIYVDLDW